MRSGASVGDRFRRGAGGERLHQGRDWDGEVGRADACCREVGERGVGIRRSKTLSLPVLEPFRCSRKWMENGSEWREAVARASRLGPGGAGVSTFMSPCEKACGHALGLAGGRWIVLSPEGFGDRWHPGRQYERFCAEGRMLFISLWPAMTREPTRAELYDRCHQMGDIVVEGLTGKRIGTPRLRGGEGNS